MPSIRKGDFTREVRTQEDCRKVRLSFSDELEKQVPTMISDPQERLAVQIDDGKGKLTVVYLGRDQVDSLISSLQSARMIWFTEY